MADLMVTMGIDDRGVRQGIRRAEDAVHRSQTKMNGAFGGDPGGILKTEKGINKIAGALSGLPLKAGALGAAFYAFKNAGEYISEFEHYLPKAERSMDGLTGAVKRFKDSWAMDARSGAAGTAGVLEGLVDLFGKAREGYTDYAAIVMKLAGGGGAELGAGDTPAEYRKAQQEEMKLLESYRIKENSLVRQKQLESEIAATKQDQLAAELAAAEARRVAASVALGQRVRNEGYGGDEKTRKEMFAERDAIRVRYDADVDRAHRNQTAREEDAAREKEAKDRKQREDDLRAVRQNVDDRLAIEKDRIRAMELMAQTPEEKLDAKRAKARLDFAERIADLNTRAREDGLSKPDFMRLAEGPQAVRDAEIAAAEDDAAKASDDLARLATRRREDAAVDIEDARARLKATSAITDAERRAAEEARATAKFRKDDLEIKRLSVDEDQRAELSALNTAEYQATINAIRTGAGEQRRDSFVPDGLDLSSAGAFASQGQAMAFQIPGKIDRTNVLLQQSGQTLQRIEQKLDGTARFAP